jgi:FMN phosphatase YigB (HAD superfamily)
MPGARPAAIFFDVDFTLIHPGPTFQPEGYARFCARYGIHVDASQFADAVKHASEVLSQGDEADLSYDPEIFIEFTRVLTRAMGARGRDVALSSSEHGFMKPHPSIFEAARGAAHRHARL